MAQKSKPTSSNVPDHLKFEFDDETFYLNWKGENSLAEPSTNYFKGSFNEEKLYACWQPINSAEHSSANGFISMFSLPANYFPKTTTEEESTDWSTPEAGQNLEKWYTSTDVKMDLGSDSKLSESKVTPQG